MAKEMMIGLAISRRKKPIDEDENGKEENETEDENEEGADEKVAMGMHDLGIKRKDYYDSPPSESGRKEEDNELMYPSFEVTAEQLPALKGKEANDTFNLSCVVRLKAVNIDDKKSRFTLEVQKAKVAGESGESDEFTEELSDEDKVSQEEANYREVEIEGRDCGSCAHSRKYGPKMTCQIVQGQVEDGWVSDLWAHNPKTKKLPHMKPEGKRGMAAVRRLGRTWKSGKFDEIAEKAGKKYGSKKSGENVSSAIYWKKANKRKGG